MSATSPYTADQYPSGLIQAGLAAATIIYAGTMVALNAAGNAISAGDTASTRVVGRAEETADNSGGAAGEATISIRRGTFKWENSISNPVTAASLGLEVVVEDDVTLTIAAGATNDIPAGICIAIEDDGVVVDTTLAPAL